MVFNLSILTISDRASTGEAIDKSGPSLEDWANSQNGQYKVINKKIVPDSIPQIQNAIVEFCLCSDLILTTGGSLGFIKVPVSEKGILLLKL